MPTATRPRTTPQGSTRSRGQFVPADGWHARAAGDVLEVLASDASRGLTSAESRRRLEDHGPNRLPEAPRRGPLVRFLLQFHNPLIYVLLAA